jgi:hypothetical protein
MSNTRNSGNLRYTSAAQVFEAFPSAQGDIEAKPTDDKPLDFVDKLLRSQAPEDSVSFCAYMMDRRQAVWWAAACVRALGGPRNREEEVALLTAEAWIRDPEEHRRKAAMELAMDGDKDLPGVWVAMAAGGSGGTMVTGSQAPGPPVPPHLCARAVRAAVLVAVAGAPIEDRARRIADCVAICRRLFDAPNR